MLYKKKGQPSEGQVVVCTVKDVQRTSVFVDLDEYDTVGMIHISEISPGRVRNIRDYVKEGKKIVCKVLRDRRGHLDLSFRRVNESQKREKNNSMKKEKKAEKIVEAFAADTKTTLEKAYAEITKKLFEDYEYLHQFFEEVSADQTSIKELGLSKTDSAKLEKLIRERIKTPQVELKGIIHMKTYLPNGVNLIKDTLKKTTHDALDIKYLGNGRYSIKIITEDYSSAEKILKTNVETAVSDFIKAGGEARFERVA